eukprot:EG_transcript_48584
MWWPGLHGRLSPSLYRADCDGEPVRATWRRTVAYSLAVVFLFITALVVLPPSSPSVVLVRQLHRSASPAGRLREAPRPTHPPRDHPFPTVFPSSFRPSLAARVHVPSDSFGGLSPERKAPEPLRRLF